MSTAESRVPTQQFLLPGQQFCVGLPWERADLPKHGLPPAPPAPAPQVNPFDKAELEADPVAGIDIGCCQVIRRLSSNSGNALLAMRVDPREGTALVCLRKLDLPDEGMQDLLEHAHWASHFRHPNLARVYGSEASDEGIFWVTEFASGATLHEINATCRKIGKSVPAGLALSIIHEAALALGELHVPGAHPHGFISDESVFVTFDGHSKLLDLGLMRCIAGKILRPEGLAAMAPYLSPEQVHHGRMPDPKTDVYALAALLHETLSGQKLPNGFERQPHFVPPSSFNVALGRELDAVMARALTPDRSKRFSNAVELAKALKAATSAFMWKAEPRADFVSGLFQTRKRREQVLLAGCEEKVWRPTRTPTAPKLPVAPTPSAPKPTTSMRAQQPAASASSAAASKKKPTPQRRSYVRTLALAAVACGLAFVWERGLADGFINPPEPVAVNASLALRNAPAQLPAEASDVTESSEEVAERSLEHARSVYASRPKVAGKSSVRKKEAPLPPWLQPKRGRR